RQVHFLGVERGAFEDLKADAETALLVDHGVIEPVHDHGAMVGRRQHERDLAPGISHVAQISFPAATAEPARMWSYAIPACSGREKAAGCRTAGTRAQWDRSNTMSAIMPPERGGRDRYGRDPQARALPAARRQDVPCRRRAS